MRQVFRFEPLPESRFRDYRLRVLLPPGSRAKGTAEGLSYVTLHGRRESLPRLECMTRAGGLLADRDLVFRAWSADGFGRRLGLAAERLGWRGPLALVLFLAAGAAALRLGRGRRVGDGTRPPAARPAARCPRRGS